MEMASAQFSRGPSQVHHDVGACVEQVQCRKPETGWDQAEAFITVLTGTTSIFSMGRALSDPKVSQ